MRYNDAKQKTLAATEGSVSRPGGGRASYCHHTTRRRLGKGRAFLFLRMKPISKPLAAHPPLRYLALFQETAPVSPAVFASKSLGAEKNQTLIARR